MSFEIEYYFKSMIDYKKVQKELTASDREKSDIQSRKILKVRSRVDEIKEWKVWLLPTNKQHILDCKILQIFDT